MEIVIWRGHEYHVVSWAASAYSGGIEHLWFQFLASNQRLAKSYLFFQQWTKTNATGRVRGGGWMLERESECTRCFFPEPNTCVLSEPSRNNQK